MDVVATESEIVEELAVEYARVAHLGWWRISLEQPDAYRSIRAAGEALNAIGGFSAMRDATLEVFKLGDGEFSTGVDFNRLWDGIGAWRA